MTKNFAAIAILLCFAIGCRENELPPAAEFEPNHVLAYHMGQESEQLMDDALAQSNQALTDLFGTPDEPKWPSILQSDKEFASLIDVQNLSKAAGSDGLFAVHKCAECHGVTGNGRGKTAALLNPYPRDYRLGRFKFKSTPIGTKPTKEDLAYLIRNGIGGTQMVKIPALTEEEIQTLVDYVIYLTVRGEVERSLLTEAGQLDFTDPEDPESLYTPYLQLSEDEDELELYADQWDLIEDFVTSAAEDWTSADEDVAEIPKRDPALVPDTSEALRLAMQEAEDSVVNQSIARGKELFVSEKAACSKCHGKEGKGDGQTNDYDDWAKEWTKRHGIDPAKPEEHVPLIARGALPVRNVAPRNFQEGVFRGGGTPEKLYQRIALGIEGTPMPAAAIEPAQIWDIVNYIRSLHDPKDQVDEVDTEVDTEADKASDEVASN